MDLENDPEWLNLVEKSRDDAFRCEDTELINFGVLWAIVDFVYNYFHESFQYTLIKLALSVVPNAIAQKVNSDWATTKIIIPVEKPKQEKPKKDKKKRKDKKGKKKKDKKGEKKKSGKGSKKSKSGKSSKSSKKGKTGKKDKKGKKGKKDKKEKKGKKEKKKMSKEEKKELERLKKEEEERERHKKFLAPLMPGDEFFEKIFDDWVRVALHSKGKNKKGKGKKGKLKGKKHGKK